MQTQSPSWPAEAGGVRSSAAAAIPESTLRREIVCFMHACSQNTSFAATCMTRPSFDEVMRPNAELVNELFGFNRLV